MAISSVKKHFDGRFDSVDGRFDSIDGRFDSIDGRFDSIDKVLKTLATKDDLEKLATKDDVKQLKELILTLSAGIRDGDEGGETLFHCFN